MNKIINNIKSFGFKLYIHLKEKKYNGRLKYLMINKNSSDLVVVFSGFPSDNHPRYNYVKTMRKFRNKASLFILDDFGYKGSYYWFEKGADTPRLLVEGLLTKTISQKKYKNIYMIGTSKGGTCAIYYGLQFNANKVFSGANQYFIGKYLNVPERKQIFNAMTGGGDDDIWEKKMDSIMHNQLQKFSNSSCIINLLYSKNEHTYDDDIRDMIADFNVFGIKYLEKVETFNDHGEVGYYFIPWIIDNFRE